MTRPRLADRPGLLVGLLAFLVVAPVMSAPFDVAGSDEHAWFLLPSPETTQEDLPWALAHHGSRDEPGVYRPLRWFDRRPTAMAALGNSLWLTLPPREDRPEVIPMRVLGVQWNDRIDRYLLDPRSGLDLLPDVRTEATAPGTVVDMQATSEGPAVLLEHAPGHHSLQQLRRGRWDQLELPSGSAGRSLRLGVADDRLVLIGQQETFITLWWESDGGWAAPVDHPGKGSIQGLGRAGERFLISCISEPGTITLDLVQPGGLARLGHWPEPGTPWGLLGTRGRVLLVRDHEGLETSQVDLLTGSRGAWQPLVAGSSFGMSPWPLLIAFTASAVVLLILIRGRPGSFSLPQDLSPLPPVPRLVALLIDAIPGLIVVMGWLGGKPSLLVDAFTLSLDARGWGLYVTIVVITSAWSLAWELLVASSPGKLLMGGRLVRESGEPPPRGRLVLRSILKGLVLMLPILMITALRPPALQSAADQAAGVVVVGRRGSPGSKPGAD